MILFYAESMKYVLQEHINTLQVQAVSEFDSILTRRNLGVTLGNVLFVDDEISTLKSIKRLLSMHGFEILTANSGEEALEIIRANNIAVCVSDQRMPGMLGTDLLTKAKEISPLTVRMILTAYTDLDSLLGAINNGEIFRFILKPWNDEALLNHINDALDVHRKDKAQGDQVILALAQTIELKDPYTKGHCERVANYSVAMAQQLALDASLIADIRYGAWLHDCGKIGVHEDILNLAGSFSADQIAEIEKHPASGATVAEKASLSKRVKNVILYHHERIDGKGYPEGLQGDDIPIEAKIVAVADVYDALATDRPYRKACTEEQIKNIMTDMRDFALEDELVELLLEKIVPQFNQAVQR